MDIDWVKFSCNTVNSKLVYPNEEKLITLFSFTFSSKNFPSESVWVWLPVFLLNTATFSRGIFFESTTIPFIDCD
jgi:hypothetical protein